MGIRDRSEMKFFVKTIFGLIVAVTAFDMKQYTSDLKSGNNFGNAMEHYIKDLKGPSDDKGPAWNPADDEGKAKNSLYKVDWSSFRRR